MLHARGADPQLAHRPALELVDRQVDLQASLLADADIFHLLAILFLAAIPPGAVVPGSEGWAGRLSLSARWALPSGLGPEQLGS